MLSRPCPSCFFPSHPFYISLFHAYQCKPGDPSSIGGWRFSNPVSFNGQLVFVIRLRGWGEEEGWILRSDTSCHPVLVLQVSSASASPIFSSWPPSAILHPSHTLTLCLTHTPLTINYLTSRQPFPIQLSRRITPNRTLWPLTNRSVPQTTWHFYPYLL